MSDTNIQENAMYQSILVPLDGSEPSHNGLKHAIDIARDSKATLHLVHVIDSFPLMFELSSQGSFESMNQSLRRWAEGMLETGRRQAAEQGVKAEVVLRELTQGRVSDVLIDVAKEASCDLIVLGTHGRRGLRRLMLGSDAEAVARTSTVPVLLVPYRSVA
jgi:nucleotide-binding universal stress UspA family protein